MRELRGKTGVSSILSFFRSRRIGYDLCENSKGQESFLQYKVLSRFCWSYGDDRLRKIKEVNKIYPIPKSNFDLRVKKEFKLWFSKRWVRKRVLNWYQGCSYVVRGNRSYARNKGTYVSFFFFFFWTLLGLSHPCQSLHLIKLFQDVGIHSLILSIFKKQLNISSTRKVSK